jgi:hypothetical protein
MDTADPKFWHDLELSEAKGTLLDINAGLSIYADSWSLRPNCGALSLNLKETFGLNEDESMFGNYNSDWTKEFSSDHAQVVVVSEVLSQCNMVLRYVLLEDAVKILAPGGSLVVVEPHPKLNHGCQLSSRDLAELMSDLRLVQYARWNSESHGASKWLRQ